MTESKSEFNARLARERGVTSREVRGRRVGDWLTLADGTPCHLGMRVYHQSDPRHVGRIEKIWNSSRADVRWEISGWVTEAEKISELVAADRE